MTPSAPQPSHSVAAAWVSRLDLSQFRSYAALRLEADHRPVVLTGANGAGKTNVLEALSWLAPGRGLRGVGLADAARQTGDGSWTVAAELMVDGMPARLGTQVTPGARTRAAIIDGTPVAPAQLGRYCAILWQSPAMDGLFTGPAADRRRFLDRLIGGLNPGYARLLATFDRAMRQRNERLEAGLMRDPLADALERQMAEAATAMAAARVDGLDTLNRHAGATGPAFPPAQSRVTGRLEDALAAGEAAIDVEDAYVVHLGVTRVRDRAARRTLSGPHRSDFEVVHGGKGQAARLCSTGEQKILLLGLTLSHARATASTRGQAPIVLLDEVVAHLDTARRAAFFGEVGRLGAQLWMTGTDAEVFAQLRSKAQFFTVTQGSIRPC